MKKLILFLLLFTCFIFAQNITVTNLPYYANKVQTPIGLFGRVDSLNVAAVDTFLNVKFDTSFASYNTYGYSIGADSTYILVGSGGDGLSVVYAKGNWKYFGSDTIESIFLKGVIDTSEVYQLQAHSKLAKPDTADIGSISFFGLVNFSVGDTFRLRYRVSSADLDFEGSATFDSTSAFILNIFKLSETP